MDTLNSPDQPKLDLGLQQKSILEWNAGPKERGNTSEGGC
jgi:hypothetical protein